MKKARKATFSFLLTFSAFTLLSQSVQAYDRCYPTVGSFRDYAQAQAYCPFVCKNYGGWNNNFACGDDGAPSPMETCNSQYPGMNYLCVCGCNSAEEQSVRKKPR